MLVMYWFGAPVGLLIKYYTRAGKIDSNVLVIPQTVTGFAHFQAIVNVLQHGNFDDLMSTNL